MTKTTPQHAAIPQPWPRKIGRKLGLLRDVAPTQADAVRIQCMEVWGGNMAVSTAVEVAGLDAWVDSQPYQGAGSGGDIHYISTCGSGRISRFVVADVSGHGVDVSELAAHLRDMMRKFVNMLNMAKFAKELNLEFSNLGTQGRFATALLLTYFATTDDLVICNAGHPRPLWYNAREKKWTLLHRELPDKLKRVEGVANLPLGLIEPTDYYQFAVRLGFGDLVVLYTDSLIEASSPSGSQLGEKGLLELVSKLEISGSREMSRRIIDAVQAYRGNQNSEDDQTVLVLRHNAAEPPPMTKSWAVLTALANLTGMIDY